MYDHKKWKEFMKEDNKPQDSDESSVVAIRDEYDRFLILRRSPADEEQWMPGKWSLPGGHIIIGESPVDGGIREVWEETGLMVSNLKFVKKTGMTKTIYLYTTTEYSGEINLDTNENDKHAWASIEELDDYDTVPDLKEFLTYLVKGEQHDED